MEPRLVLLVLALLLAPVGFLVRVLLIAEGCLRHSHCEFGRTCCVLCIFKVTILASLHEGSIAASSSDVIPWPIRSYRDVVGFTACDLSSKRLGLALKLNVLGCLQKSSAQNPKVKERMQCKLLIKVYKHQLWRGIYDYMHALTAAANGSSSSSTAKQFVKYYISIKSAL